MNKNIYIKRIAAIIVFASFVLAFMAVLPSHVFANHEHSVECGYVAAVEGKPCQHVHNEQCGYQEAKAEVACNQNCIDTNGDGTIDHSEGCAYQPAIEGHICMHQHDGSCGYVEAVEGHPCQYEEQMKQNVLNEPTTYAETTQSVTTFEELKTAITNATGTADSPTVISLENQTIVVTEEIVFSNKHVIIENGTIQIDSGFTDSYLFNIDVNASMTLRNMVLNGNQVSIYAAIYQTGKLTLKDTTVENFLCRKAVLRCFRERDKTTLLFLDSSSYLESGTIFRNNTVSSTSNKTYVLIEYGANVSVNDAIFEGPGVNSKHFAILMSTAVELNDLVIKNATIKNFYVGIDTPTKTIIDDIDISDVNTGIAVGGDKGELEFKGGTIRNCSFAGIQVGTDGVLNMSGGTLTNCTTNPSYVDAGGAICCNSGGTINLTGGKITDNVASGVFLRGGIANISGSVEISQNKLGINSVSANEVNLYGGKIINNQNGMKVQSNNLKLNVGGSIIVKDNTEKNIILPSFSNPWSIIVNKDFTSDAYIAIDPTSELSDGDTVIAVVADSTYHDGLFIGTEASVFHSSNPKYEISIKENQIVMACVEKKTVKFNTYHSQTIADQVVDTGSHITEPTALVKSGYTLEGWYTSSDYTQKWDFTNDVVTGDLTLHAKWTPISYSIRYVLDGGTNVSNNPSQYTIESEDIVLSEPTRSHYSFVGWTYEGQTTPSRYVTIAQGSTGDKAFTAHWEIEHLKINFDTNGGTIISGQTVDYNQKLTQPSDPHKSGYQFVGWYTDEQLTKSYDFSQPVTKTMTLYAKYKKLNMVEKPTSQILDGQIEKGTLVELTCATPEATIYYTLDGSVPTSSSTKYNGPISVEQDVTIQAIAIKDGMMNSEVARFRYTVLSEGNVDVVIKVEGQGNIYVDNQDNVLKSVLNEADYQAYKDGNDIVITLECQLIEGQSEPLDSDITSQYQVGKYLDISVYKQIGDQEREKVTELNEELELIIDVPDELLPGSGVRRVYSVLRLHGDEKNVLRDLDGQLRTITIKTGKFSTYVILYKDITSSEKDTDEKGQNQILKTEDDSDLMVHFVLLTLSMITVIGIRNKIKNDAVKRDELN